MQFLCKCWAALGPIGTKSICLRSLRHQIYKKYIVLKYGTNLRDSSLTFLAIQIGTRRHLAYRTLCTKVPFRNSIEPIYHFCSRPKGLSRRFCIRCLEFPETQRGPVIEKKTTRPYIFFWLSTVLSVPKWTVLGIKNNPKEYSLKKIFDCQRFCHDGHFLDLT